MRTSKTNTIFQLKKVIIEIKEYDKDWRYTEDFESLVIDLNRYSKELELADFQFKEFHYSSTGKTINDTGYKSLINHVTILEDILKNPMQNNSDSSEPLSDKPLKSVSVQ